MFNGHIDTSLTKYLLVKAGSVNICGTGNPCSLPNRYSPSKCRSQPKIKKKITDRFVTDKTGTEYSTMLTR